MTEQQRTLEITVWKQMTGEDIVIFEDGSTSEYGCVLPSLGCGSPIPHGPWNPQPGSQAATVTTPELSPECETDPDCGLSTEVAYEPPPSPVYDAPSDPVTVIAVPLAVLLGRIF